MKKKLLLVFVIGIIVVCCACNNYTSEEMITEKNAHDTLNIVPVDQSFRVRFENIEPMSIVLASQPTQEGAIFLGASYKEQTNSNVQIFASYQENNRDVIQGYDMDEHTWTSAFFTENEKNYYILSETNDVDEHQILVITQEIKVDLTDYLQPNEHISWLCGIENLLIAITDNAQVIAVDMSGDVQWSKSFSQQTREVLKTKDNIILITYEAGSDVTKIQRLDIERRSLKELCDLPIELQNMNMFSGDKWGYDLLLYDWNNLYGWDFGAKEITNILKFEDISMSGIQISEIQCLNEKKLIGTVMSFSTGAEQIFYIEMCDHVEQQTELTIAGFTYPMTLRLAISEFNLAHPEYHINYHDYDELYGSKAEEQFQLDMKSGIYPDLLVLNGIDYEPYAKQELLEDLYPFIDSDPELKREDFLPNLMHSLELNGRLYRIPESFALETAVGLKEIFQDKREISIEDTMIASEQIIDGGSIYYGQDRELLVTKLLLRGYTQFIDPNTNTAKFNTQEFEEVLDFLFNMQDESSGEYQYEDPLLSLLKHEVLLLDIQIGYAATLEVMLDKTNDGVSCVGYPGSNGPVFWLNHPIAMLCASEHKDVAWEFIKILITTSGYNTRSGWLPLIDEINKSLEQEQENGVRLSTIEMVKTMIYGTNESVYYNKNITDILWNEIQPFFEGHQTAEETARLINDRVQLYLDEHDS